MITVDGNSYRDQVEITGEEIYDEIDNKEFKTSLPATEDLHKTLDEIRYAGYNEIVVINISSNLSGTYNSFRLEFEEIKDLKITQYDSKTLAAAQGYLVEEALELIKDGVEASEIMKRLDVQRFENSIGIYTINTLKYLQKGGRIGKVEGTIGNILRIKPVITVDDEGFYETLSKAFGLKRSLINMKNLLEEKFEDNKIDLTIHYGNDRNEAIKLGEILKASLNIRNLTISNLTPVLGIHTGPEMFAYIARKL